MTDRVELLPPANSDSGRSVILSKLRNNAISVIIQETTMHGNVESVGAKIRLSELVEAIEELRS